MSTANQAYVPGVCNIGRAEISQRMRFGYIGLAVLVVLWAVFIVFGVAAPWRFFLFLPATSGAAGFLQAAFHFCAGFGFKGVFNFRAAVGETDTVEQADFRRKDRAKALQIVGLSVLVGVVIALIGYFTAL